MILNMHRTLQIRSTIAIKTWFVAMSFFLVVHAPPVMGADDKGRAAAFLNSQYETVAYMDVRLLTQFHDDPNPPSADANRNHDLPLALRLPFVKFVGAIRSLAPEAESVIEGQYEHLLGGAKAFAPPTELGMYDYEGCYIAISYRSVNSKVSALFNHREKSAQHGVDFWHWSLPPVEGHPMPFAFYATTVGERYLIVATTVDAMLDAAIVMQSGSISSGILGVSEDVLTHEYWIYRPVWHMPAQIPTTKGKAGATVTAALSFVADTKLLRGTFDIRVIGNAEVSAAQLPYASGFTYSRAGPSTWKAQLAIGDGPGVVEKLYEVLSLFGFGVVL